MNIRLNHLMLVFTGFFVCTEMYSISPVKAGVPPEPGLLFYLSGDNGVKTDYSTGNT